MKINRMIGIIPLIIYVFLILGCFGSGKIQSSTPTELTGVIKLNALFVSNWQSYSNYRDSILFVHVLEVSPGIQYELLLDSAGTNVLYNPFAWAGDTISVKGVQLGAPSGTDNCATCPSSSAITYGRFLIESKINVMPKNRTRTFHGMWKWYENVSLYSRSSGFFESDTSLAILSQTGVDIDGSKWGVDSLTITGRYVGITGNLYIPDSLLPAPISAKTYSGSVQKINFSSLDSCYILVQTTPKPIDSDTLLIVNSGHYWFPDTSEIIPTTWTGWIANNGFADGGSLCRSIHSVLVLE